MNPGTAAHNARYYKTGIAMRTNKGLSSDDDESEDSDVDRNAGMRKRLKKANGDSTDDSEGFVGFSNTSINSETPNCSDSSVYLVESDLSTQVIDSSSDDGLSDSEDEQSMDSDVEKKDEKK